MRDMEHKRAYDRERSKWRPKYKRPPRENDPEYQKRWRAAHPDYSVQWRLDHPGYSAQWRLAHPDYTKEYRRAHRVEINARSKVNRLRRNGIITRLDCEICGAPEQVDAHHPFGYEGEMAVAVWWLCKAHHMSIHQAMREK